MKSRSATIPRNGYSNRERRGKPSPVPAFSELYRLIVGDKSGDHALHSKAAFQLEGVAILFIRLDRDPPLALLLINGRCADCCLTRASLRR